MIIDTHCHYNLEPLSENVVKHWKKAQESGVEASIVVGTDLENSKLAIEIASNNQGLYASIGLHPGNCQEDIKKLLIGDTYSQVNIDKSIDNHLNLFEVLLNQQLSNHNLKLLAVGEIGLDYYRLKTKGLKRQLVVEMQKRMFQFQLNLAFKNNLLAIIHVRDQNDRHLQNAYQDTINILEDTIQSLNVSPRFILHCASGSLDYIKKGLKLGAYIGVAGNVTYDNAENIRAIIDHTPSNRILLETDAPYLVPKGYKTQICEPYMIKTTAEFLQQKMKINLDIIRQNVNNFLFNK